jgi:hypothetical protein
MKGNKRCEISIIQRVNSGWHSNKSLLISPLRRGEVLPSYLKEEKPFLLKERKIIHGGQQR